MAVRPDGKDTAVTAGLPHEELTMTEKISAPAAGPGGRVPAPADSGAGAKRWRRRLMWPVLAAVIVIAVVLAGGGWYFADQIRSTALAVEPAGPLPPYDDVKVVAASAGR